MPEFEQDFVEYGIALRSENRGNQITTAHRYGMSVEDAKQWINEWEAGGGRKGAFVIIRRPIGRWSIYLD